MPIDNLNIKISFPDIATARMYLIWIYILFLLGVDVIGDIGYGFVMWQANSINNGNKTIDSYGQMAQYMT